MTKKAKKLFAFISLFKNLDSVKSVQTVSAGLKENTLVIIQKNLLNSKWIYIVEIYFSCVIPSVSLLTFHSLLFLYKPQISEHSRQLI